MKLRIHLSTLLVAASLVLALHPANGHADPITYNLDASAFPGDPYTLSGFITTDGNLGSLSPSDIISWGFSLNQSDSFDVTATGTGFGVSNSGQLNATALNLYVSIQTEYDEVAFFFDNHGFIIWAVWPQDLSNVLCDVRDIQTGEFVSDIGPLPSSIVIATSASVPEPSSILLTLAAIGAGYGGWRRSRRKAAGQPQVSPQVHS